MNWLRFKLAWICWWFIRPFRLGDPLLGSGEERQKNLKIILDRYYASEPKWNRKYGQTTKDGETVWTNCGKGLK
jgi:hypothetical protein